METPSFSHGVPELRTDQGPWGSAVLCCPLSSTPLLLSSEEHSASLESGSPSPALGSAGCGPLAHSVLASTQPSLAECRAGFAGPLLHIAAQNLHLCSTELASLGALTSEARMQARYALSPEPTYGDPVYGENTDTADFCLLGDMLRKHPRF